MTKFLNPRYWWRRQQRAIDHQILFPQIRKLAEENNNPVVGAQAVLAHVAIDSAWKYREEYSLEDHAVVIKSERQLPPADAHCSERFDKL